MLFTNPLYYRYSLLFSLETFLLIDPTLVFIEDQKVKRSMVKTGLRGNWVFIDHFLTTGLSSVLESSLVLLVFLWFSLENNRTFKAKFVLGRGEFVEIKILSFVLIVQSSTRLLSVGSIPECLNYQLTVRRFRFDIQLVKPLSLAFSFLFYLIVQFSAIVRFTWCSAKLGYSISSLILILSSLVGCQPLIHTMAAFNPSQSQFYYLQEFALQTCQ